MNNKTLHPVQLNADLRDGKIPESVALAAYEVYCHLYGEQEALIDVEKGCRGGFGVGELIGFLYARSFPKSEWRARANEMFDRNA